MLLIGLLLGTVSRLLDIYTQNLGNIFSQFSVWILIGVFISVKSSTAKKAAANVFAMSAGMLVTYYAVAVLSNGVYSEVFIVGWSVFAALTPVMAFFAWQTRKRGVFPTLIGVGIIMFQLLSTVVLFDRLRVYDFLFLAALVYLLFIRKKKGRVSGVEIRDK